ncbi:MAG: tetraacyldisaccharide 4'-kinase [Bacteroidia bacterium]|nr:tetraacyldisaccharide 4'-kinase [Bacteroidia bacterium]
MEKLRYLLMPFGWIYGLVMLLRSRLYKSGFFSSYNPPIPTICIGNLQVGGTGKTPHTEFLAAWLSKNHKIAVLSRGYKRKTKGFIKASPLSTALEIGDEPLQISRKNPNITVAVCEKRADGIQKLLSEDAGLEIILLDDAMQHLSVTPELTILLSELDHPYFDDKMMPAGRLREFYTGEKRADVIIFTKCPLKFSQIKKIEFIRQLDPYDHQEVYFTAYKYGKLKHIISGEEFSGSINEQKMIILTGIANPKPFSTQVRSFGTVTDEFNFPDHHNFSETDLSDIFEKAGTDTIIVTTEKDAMRLEPFVQQATESAISKQFPSIYYIPIETFFLFDEEVRFKSRILEILK